MIELFCQSIKTILFASILPIDKPNTTSSFDVINHLQIFFLPIEKNIIIFLFTLKKIYISFQQNTLQRLLIKPVSVFVFVFAFPPFNKELKAKKSSTISHKIHPNLIDVIQATQNLSPIFSLMPPNFFCFGTLERKKKIPKFHP